MSQTTSRRRGRALVIPAAGLGTRLRSALPKVLVPVAGRPMIDWLLALYEDYVDQVVVIANPASHDAVRKHLTGWSDLAPAVVIQEAATGMLDAILCATERVAATEASRVWISWCDQVAIDPRTVRALAERSDRGTAAVVMPTCRQKDPYIHLERDANGRITRVLHRREGDDMPPVGESDAGLFSLTRDAFLIRLPEYAADVPRGASTGERNFLPFLSWIASRDGVETFSVVDERESLGVNTPEDLAALDGYLRMREAM